MMQDIFLGGSNLLMPTSEGSQLNAYKHLKIRSLMSIIHCSAIAFCTLSSFSAQSKQVSLSIWTVLLGMNEPHLCTVSDDSPHGR